MYYAPPSQCSHFIISETLSSVIYIPLLVHSPHSDNLCRIAFPLRSHFSLSYLCTLTPKHSYSPSSHNSFLHIIFSSYFVYLFITSLPRLNPFPSSYSRSLNHYQQSFPTYPSTHTDPFHHIPPTSYSPFPSSNPRTLTSSPSRSLIHQL